MEKHEIKVAVKSKKQAMKFKKKLKSRGEPVDDGFWIKELPDYHQTTLMFFDNYWFVTRDDVKLTQIKFKLLLEILDGKEKNISVKVENELEYEAMNKYCKENGFFNTHSKYSNWFNGIVYFNLQDRSASNKAYSNNVIPFKCFAEQHNIKVPLLKSEEGVWLYDGDECTTVNIEHNCIGCTYWKVDKALNPNYYKAFSTKEAAEKWIEENNKPKVIELTLGYGNKAVVTTKGIRFEDRDGFSDFTLSHSDLYQINKAIKSLN